jgi:hypothetical protein
VELGRKEEELLGDSNLIRAAQSTAHQKQSSVISS